MVIEAPSKGSSLRGRLAHVLLTAEPSRRVSGAATSIVDRLAMSSAAELEFDPPRAQSLTKPAELSLACLVFLLDTTVVSELRKAKTSKANPGVVAWAGSVLYGSLFIPAITVLELEMGVLQVERRDAVQDALLRAWLEAQVLPAFNGQILPVDVTVAQRCACLHVPDPRAERDALISATALVHGTKVVTRNTAACLPTGVSLLNPWQ